MTAAITDLQVIVGDSVPPGFTKIAVDLNKGAHGEYIYLCFKRDSGNPITGLAVILGQQTKPPSGYKKIPVDLNQGAKGEYVYLCYKESPDKSLLGSVLNPITQPTLNVTVQSSPELPILDIIFQYSSEEHQHVPRGYDKVPYSKIPVDLNKGANGVYIYLYYLAKYPDVPPSFGKGIKAEMLNNPEQEYEISRVQISHNRQLVRTQKLEFTYQQSLGKSIPWEYTQEVTKGTQRSEVNSFSVEVGISASATYGGFSSEINTKLGYSTTNSFSTSEETKTTVKVNVVAAPYDRTFAFCTVIDILRVVDIPSGDPVSELRSRTPNYGIFVTNDKHQWASV